VLFRSRGVALDHQAHVARPERVVQSKWVAGRADVVLPAQPLKQGTDGEPATSAGEELAHKRLERVEHVRVQFVERLKPLLDRRVGRVIRGPQRREVEGELSGHARPPYGVKGW